MAQIYIARIDGSEPRQICDGDCPSGSPDGKKIACCFVDQAHPKPEIRVVNHATGRAETVGAGRAPPVLVARRQEPDL